MNYFIEVIPGESVFGLAYAKGNREGECVKKDYGNVIRAADQRSVGGAGGVRTPARR